VGSAVGWIAISPSSLGDLAPEYTASAASLMNARCSGGGLTREARVSAHHVGQAAVPYSENLRYDCR